MDGALLQKYGSFSYVITSLKVERFPDPVFRFKNENFKTEQIGFDVSVLISSRK